MRLFRLLCCSFLAFLIFTSLNESYGWPHHKKTEADHDAGTVRGEQTGIKEIVQPDAWQRYQNWKDELLSTDFGRAQWNQYALRKDFLLTIIVSDDRKSGAGTDGFEWDDRGNLIAARITLGRNLDRGYPDPVYYPVMNALAAYDGTYQIDGDILASTKLIHEIAHVNSTSQANAKLFQRQNKLMSSYNNLFLRNGYNTQDPRLVELAEELGAKPIEIWEDREYQSEAVAMRYLMERMHREWFYCYVIGRMKRNIADYARGYQDRFGAIVDSGTPACRN